MQSIYFDTSCYNKIVEHSKHRLITEMLRKASDSGKFEVLFSYLNFEEFCHTPDVHRKTQLFKLAYSICRHRFILSHEKLIRKELESYLGDYPLNKENIYDTSGFEDFFSEAIDGSLFQGAPIRLFKEMKKRKRLFLKFEINSIKKLLHLWEAHRTISFNEFYRNTLRNNEGKATLKEICIRALENNKRIKKDFSAIDLEKLPGVRCLFKYMCASIYNQVVRNKKPKWGSGIDMNHSVYLGYCDIFVTGDRDFLDMIKLFKEIKVKCLSFNEFIVQYIDINT